VRPPPALGQRGAAVDVPPDDGARPPGGTPSYETRRAEFIGRGRSTIDPQAMHVPALGDGEGSVLDPVVAIRNTVVIAPGETVQVHLVTGIAETREGALALIDKYSDRHSADRVFNMSWTHSQVLLRRLDATEADTQLYDRLASNILYSSPSLRAPRSVVARNQRGQSSLWAYAISGDLPIALVRIGTGNTWGWCASWSRPTRTCGSRASAPT
jgi:cyclic beta-1,2-glucan synthetase